MAKKAPKSKDSDIIISLEAKIMELEKEIKSINSRISGLKPVKIPEGVKAGESRGINSKVQYPPNIYLVRLLLDVEQPTC